MEIIKDEEGSIKIRYNKEEEYTKLYHGYNGRKYILFYKDKNNKNIYIDNNEDIENILSFISNLKIKDS